MEGKSWPVSDIRDLAVMEELLWDDIYRLHSVSGPAWGLVWMPVYGHVGWREKADQTQQESVREEGDLPPESHRADDLWYLERTRWQAYRTSLRWVVLRVRFSEGLLSGLSCL